VGTDHDEDVSPPSAAVGPDMRPEDRNIAQPVHSDEGDTGITVGLGDLVQGRGGNGGRRIRPSGDRLVYVTVARDRVPLTLQLALPAILGTHGPSADTAYCYKQTMTSPVCRARSHALTRIMQAARACSRSGLDV